MSAPGIGSGPLTLDTPRLLAIDDVHVVAPPDLAAGMAEFYTAVIGFHLIEPQPEASRLVFCGYSAMKPRLVVRLDPKERARLRGYVAVQVASLQHIEERAGQRGFEVQWSHRLSFFDRRLTIFDPAGNHVEVVSYHML